MKKFKFRFQVVLNKVSMEMDNIAIALAEKKRALKQSERVLKGYQLMLKNYNQQFKEDQKKVLAVEEIIHYQRFLGKIQVDIRDQEEKMSELKTAVTQIREILIEKNKEKKMLEKLKETDFKAYVQGIESAEQRLLDELSTLNYNRQA